MEKKDKESKFDIIIPQGAHDEDKPKKMRLKKRTHCVRCGSCCTEGSPALLKDDLQLFLSGALSHEAVYTVREGERVRSSGDDDTHESFMELVKIRTKEGTPECIFYRGEKEGCALYEHRPVQCREYECWAPAHNAVFEGIEKRRLTREDIFHSLDFLMEIIKGHEEKCSYKRLSDACGKLAARDENAVEEIMEMLQYDTYARPFLQERFAIPGNALDLILGRPLIDTIREFGFQVKKEGGDYIVLPI